MSIPVEVEPFSATLMLRSMVSRSTIRFSSMEGASTRWWRRLEGFRGLSAARSRQVHSPEEFHALLMRECCRTDRSGAEFSLLLFAVDAGRSRAEDLLRALLQRVRQTDAIGWTEDGSVGVFLPDTPAEGAHKLARDICAILADRPEPRCSIHTYPGDWFPDVGRSSPRLAAAERRRSADEGMQTRSAPPPGRPIPRWKRWMDVVGALAAIVLLAPLMLGIALVIKLTSQGPVIYRQQRIGHRGRTFLIYKFRSMTAGASEAVHVDYVRQVVLGTAQRNREGALKLADDPRVTRVGAFLRKWSLDELPQLFNVLKGEMSLVGPRPDPLYASADYRPWYHRRTLHVKPGMTGLWQVEGRSRVTFEEMIRLDLQYSDSLSFATDVRILLRTFRAVLSHAGAY